LSSAWVSSKGLLWSGNRAVFFLSSWLLSHCKNGVPFRPKEFSQNSIKLWIFLARHVHRASEEGSGNGLGFKLVKKLFDT